MFGDLYCSVYVFIGTATTKIYTYGHTLSLPYALPIGREEVGCHPAATVRRHHLHRADASAGHDVSGSVLQPHLERARCGRRTPDAGDDHGQRHAGRGNARHGCGRSARCNANVWTDRKRVVYGKSVYVSVGLVGIRLITIKK